MQLARFSAQRFSQANRNTAQASLWSIPCWRSSSQDRRKAANKKLLTSRNNSKSSLRLRIPAIKELSLQERMNLRSSKETILKKRPRIWSLRWTQRVRKTAKLFLTTSHPSIKSSSRLWTALISFLKSNKYFLRRLTKSCFWAWAVVVSWRRWLNRILMEATHQSSWLSWFLASWTVCLSRWITCRSVTLQEVCRYTRKTCLVWVSR